MIIFDVMGLVHSFGGRYEEEFVLGGRPCKYADEAHQFFGALRDSGAKMYFVCDAQIQPNRFDVWCSRRNEEYNNALKILGEIDNGKYCCGQRYRQRGSKHFVVDLLKIAEEYGSVFLSIDNDCDAVIGQLAVAENALAVVASDSDF